MSKLKNALVVLKRFFKYWLVLVLGTVVVLPFGVYLIESFIYWDFPKLEDFGTALMGVRILILVSALAAAILTIFYNEG